MADGDASFDLVVVGAGAAGMTAALVGALDGARTMVIESTPQVGGTSARSSGTVWIPRDTDAARVYLDALVGGKADPSLRQAFLAAGPAMIDCLESRAGFRFRPFERAPDYRQDLPGAALGVRPLEPEGFDGRTLGPRFADIAWPLTELMLFGGMMVTRAEAARLLESLRSPRSAFFGLRLVARYLADRLRYPRGTRLVLGNALVARLYKALVDRNVPVETSTQVERLLVEGGRVVGLAIRRGGIAREVRARRGVVLAGGGFPASAAWRERHFRSPVARHTSAYEGCVGETLRLGQEAGGALGASGEDNALWFPGSILRRADGTTGVYPHIVLDRGKPGLVAVGRSGARFVDEAASYHEFVRAMYRTGNVPAWLVCDRRFLWRYGLGAIRPLTPALALRRHLASGYVVRSNGVESLAGAIGVDAAGLVDSVRRQCEFARTGIDTDFGKGANPYDRAGGDAKHGPNPCLGAIAEPPFYAMQVEPTPLGTSLGLRTNEHAQVCDATGRPIPGLYAAGNDMQSPMGGEYPGAGAQLGLGMAFGYVAARHALRDAAAPSASTPAARELTT